jgi:hypothetical protein
MQFFNNPQERIIQDQLISLLEQATNSFKIAMAWFTNNEIFDVLLKKQSNPGFSTELIVLNDRINNKKEGVDFQKLIANKGSFYYSDVDKMVHHKFCIIDNKIVVTGSYNWTYYAEQRNWENVIVISEPEAVNAYIQEFDKIIGYHERVENVAAKKKYAISIIANDYLETDYAIQAQRELQKGNDVKAAMIYTEVLRLNNNKEEVKKARLAIIDKVNNQHFDVCPFEIGIQYRNGYSTAIPAFTKLPFTKIMGGSTPSDTATSLQVTIQKYD